jgi:hypothetical protein
VPDPIHLRPTAELAQRALLPGDPGRALALAQALFDKPARMFNHHRGLWGYTGTAIDGGLLTVQSTGMGGPSSAIVLEELCELGLRRAVRVGTCAALGDGARLGELIAVREALAGDGTSRALGAGDVVAGDAALGEALAARADHAGRVPAAISSMTRPASDATPGARPARWRSTSRPRRSSRWPGGAACEPGRCWPSPRAPAIASTAKRSMPPACASAVRPSPRWPTARLLLADLEALLVAGHGRGRAGERLLDGDELACDAPELLLDRAQPALQAGGGVERGESPVEAVDAVLDALEPL